MIEKNWSLYSKLTDDLSKDVACSEVQKGVSDIVELTKSTTLGIDFEIELW